MEPRRKQERSWEKLLRATSARCRGATLVLGRDVGALARAVRDRGLEVVGIDLPCASDSAAAAPATGGAPSPSECADLRRLKPSWNTAVVTGVLEDLPVESGAELLTATWRLLKPGGRLIVTVPNVDCMAEPHGRPELNKRGLRRLLKPLGKPRLATDQPLKWLTMYVERPRHARPHQNRTRVERFRVTARLCRGKVLELGCGEGHLAKVISDRRLQVVGVDLNDEKIRRAREEYPQITFLEGDIRNVAFPEQEFDTVILAEVLEHVSEETGAEMLARAWPLLKPGGRLIVSVPNEDCIPHPNHVRRFDRRGLKMLLEPLGKPRLVTDQPYKWLMMYVTKARPGTG